MTEQEFKSQANLLLQEISAHRNWYDCNSLNIFFAQYKEFVTDNEFVPFEVMEELIRLDLSLKRHTSENSNNKELQAFIRNLESDIQSLVI